MKLILGCIVAAMVAFTGVSLASAQTYTDVTLTSGADTWSQTDATDYRVYALNGDDSVFAGSGNDLLYLSGGDDSASGRAGDDIIKGGYGDDTIGGYDGADRILGEWGADWIDGGFGDDTLTGDRADERGNVDVFYFIGTYNTDGTDGWYTGGAGVDKITDFESGVDKIEFDGTDATIPTTVDEVRTTADGLHTVIFYQDWAGEIILRDNGSAIEALDFAGATFSQNALDFFANN